MRGGSRYGAGRPGWKGKVEGLLRLDIRRFVSKCELVPGATYGWQWTQDDEKIASIGIRITSNDSLSLEYNWTPDEEPTQSVVRHITLRRTNCHYGGQRVWFICPHCGRTAAILYLLRGHWYCRKSLKVAYASQSMDVMGRMHKRIAKLEAKLGEDGRKPKGMHTSTYKRIWEKLDDAESRLDYAFLLHAERLFDL